VSSERRTPGEPARIAILLGAVLSCRPPAPPPPGPPSVSPAPAAVPHGSPPSPARYLRTLAHDPGGYDPGQLDGVVVDLLLGDLLFHSPATLGPAAASAGLSCNRCHPNGATDPGFFLAGVSDRPGNVDLTTGHFRPGADNRIDDFVNIPSLRGLRFTGPYGHDGRTASLSEFVRDVVSGEFGGAPLPPAQLSALVRYVHDFDFLPNANLDEHGRLTTRAGDAAHRGERLFLAPRAGFDGGSCATCHVRSAFFRDGRAHRLGTGNRPSPHALDDGFQTPTLLGTAETAPYFHDGRFATLAQVVAWFDDRFALGLSPSDRADLAAYLEAVGAVDRRTDDRPLAKRMADVFVYLTLLVDGDGRDDRGIWGAALDACAAELESHPRPAALASTIAALDDRLRAVAAAARGGAPLPPLRADVLQVQGRLFRLSADWAGALASR
jgi:mono/diheme cytochrome c family protein